METPMNSGMQIGPSKLHAGMIAGAVALLVVGGIVGYVMGNSGSSPVVSETTSPTTSVVAIVSATPTTTPTSSPATTTSPTPAGSTSYKVYFANIVKNPGFMDCNLTYPVSRTVSKTTTPLRAALLSLLAGPTTTETNLGFRRTAPSGMVLDSVVIDQGLATATFYTPNRTPNEAHIGLCADQHFISSVEKTMKQFSSVQRVRILVNEEEFNPEP